MAYRYLGKEAGVPQSMEICGRKGANSETLHICTEKEPEEDIKRNTLRGVDERRMDNKIKENRKGLLGS
jgi:hypothetical protein